MNQSLRVEIKKLNEMATKEKFRISHLSSRRLDLTLHQVSSEMKWSEDKTLLGNLSQTFFLSLLRL